MNEKPALIEALSTQILDLRAQIETLKATNTILRAQNKAQIAEIKCLRKDL